MLLYTVTDPLSQLSQPTICTSNILATSTPCCRLVSSFFLHDSFLHLILNSAALFQLAPEAEAVLGYPTFAAVYLLSGLGAGLATIAFSDTISVGASACIFGLIGALAGYIWRNRSIHQTGQQLGLVAAVCAFNLLAGSDHRTAVENLGKGRAWLLACFRSESVHHASPVGRAASEMTGTLAVQQYQQWSVQVTSQGWLAACISAGAWPQS